MSAQNLPYNRKPFVGSARWLALTFLAPSVAWAELELVPFGSAQYEHHSNIFEVSGPNEAQQQRGESKRADSVWQGRAGLEASYVAGQQKLEVNGEARKLKYQHFDDLDHDEYSYGGKFSWRLGSTVAGNVAYQQDRKLASFADLDTSELTQQTERRASAMLGYDVTPSWRIEAGAGHNQSKLPLPDDPEFKLQDSNASLELKYHNQGRWATGLLGEVRDGSYSGNEEHERDFKEGTVQLTADYFVSDLSTLRMKVGATQRKEDAGNDGEDGDDGTVSGFTGSFAYGRTISAKTAVDIEIFRRVDSYIAGANALIATGGSTSLNWKPTPTLSLAARYEYTRSSFESDGDTEDAGRSDRYSGATLELSYEVLRWLTLRPYAGYRNRESSLDTESFEDVITGAELRARFY